MSAYDDSRSRRTQDDDDYYTRGAPPPAASSGSSYTSYMNGAMYDPYSYLQPDAQYQQQQQYYNQAAYAQYPQSGLAPAQAAYQNGAAYRQNGRSPIASSPALGTAYPSDYTAPRVPPKDLPNDSTSDYYRTASPMPSVYSGATLVKNSDANHANSKPMRSLADRRHTVTDAIRGTLTRLGSKSTKDTKDYYPIIEDEPEARRKCRFLACCIPRNKTARGVCFAVVALVLIGLGVVGYIFWPRFPDFKVLAVELKPTNTFSIVRNATYPNNFNYATFIIALQMNVSVTNNNLYNLNIESLNIATFLNVNKTELDKEGIKPQTLNIDGFVGPVLTGTAPTTYVPSYTPQIGAGNKSAVLFPAKSTKTLMMDLTIAYTPDRITGLVRDPSFAEIINVCGILGKARTAAISYSAKSTVATLKNFGYTPAVNGMVTINCPIAADMISQFQGLVESGVDIMTAFEMVFGGGMGEEVGVMTGGA